MSTVYASAGHGNTVEGFKAGHLDANSLEYHRKRAEDARAFTESRGQPLNTSGIDPLDLRVLVLPDAPESITPGGIIIPEPELDKQAMAMTLGTLVATGENAWEEAASRSPHFTKPVAGDRIVFGKYSGIDIKGRDGVKYRLMNDEDVVGRER